MFFPIFDFSETKSRLCLKYFGKGKLKHFLFVAKKKLDKKRSVKKRKNTIIINQNFSHFLVVKGELFSALESITAYNLQVHLCQDVRKIFFIPDYR